MNEDKCVCCGDVVPEGRYVCPQCEHQIMKLCSFLPEDIPLAKRKARAFRLLQRRKKGNNNE